MDRNIERNSHVEFNKQSNGSVVSDSTGNVKSNYFIKIDSGHTRSSLGGSATKPTKKETRSQTLSDINEFQNHNIPKLNLSEIRPGKEDSLFSNEFLETKNLEWNKKEKEFSKLFTNSLNDSDMYKKMSTTNLTEFNIGKNVILDEDVKHSNKLMIEEETGELLFNKKLIVNAAGLETGLRGKRDGMTFFGSTDKYVTLYLM